jgi:DNA repair protein RecN (Recombination protein N)
MINFIKINNIALAAQVDLEFGAGLTLLTGETGAGKSILVDALSLVLGARASSDLIRSGEDAGSVEALVEWSGAEAFLASHGLPSDGPEVVLRRELHASGKGRASINGALVPVALLRELSAQLARLHGQHEPQGLLDPGTHLEILDRFARLDTDVLAAPFRALRAAEQALAELQRDRREHARRVESLRFQLDEIDQAHLSPGEDEALRLEKSLCLNAGRLAQLSGEAYTLLYDDESAVLARLGQAFKRVEELASLDPRFTAHLERRADVRAALEDLAFFLRDYSEGLELRPGRLDEIEARLAAIERFQRKYGSTLADVLAYGERCREELLASTTPEERERQLEFERQAALRTYLGHAERLAEQRRVAARELSRRMEAELSELAMERTRFTVRFSPEVAPAATDAALDTRAFTARGLEEVEFLLSPNPGEDLRPLARIASGGELARILLALTVAANLDEAPRTLVFDEVDSGIGGRVAEVVGRKLHALGRRHQVLCVTHLPQIAAFAEHHYVVRKRQGRARTVTEVAALNAAQRVEELARMLGGEVVGDAARRHAQEMLQQSHATVMGKP